MRIVIAATTREERESWEGKEGPREEKKEGGGRQMLGRESNKGRKEAKAASGDYGMAMAAEGKEGC